MTYPLRIELAEDAYLALVNTAQHIGQTPERLAAQWLSEDICRWPAADPIESLIGAFHSQVTDWADWHDEYLGNAMMVMRQLGIADALTTDHHFEQAGFVRLLK